MSLTRLWRCELRRFVICSAVSGGVLVFGCLPGERATSLFLRFLVAPFRARCVLTSVFLSYTFCFFFLLCCVFPRYLRLFCIVYAILLWLMAVCVRLFSKVFCCIG